MSNFLSPDNEWPNDKPIIEVKDLTITYQNTLALYGVNLEVYPGEIIGICGPNGAGKTSLLKAILGLIKPYKGQIKVYGQPIQTSGNLFKKQHFKIGYVPQLRAIDRNFPALVKDVVMMGRYPKIGLFKRPSKKDWEIVYEALRAIDMYYMRNRPIGHLSGGQQQKVFIARALALEPSILLLDEPTAALDFRMTASIMQLLRKLRDDKNMTIVSIHHDLELLKENSTRIVCLNKSVAWTGPPDDPELDEILRKVYPLPTL